MNPPQQYFDDSWCALATEALKECAASREYFNKCSATGCPVEDQVSVNERQSDFFTKFKAQFFPHMA